MDHLDELENQSIFIIREAYSHFRNMAMLWSIGKDSTTLLWLCKKAFFGKVPFPVMHIDTSYKFPEIYKFRDEYVEKWGLKLVVARNSEQIEKGMGPEKGHLECCEFLKTDALKQAINKHKFDALLLGIRRDEHGIRAKERVFSPRDETFKWNYKDQSPEMWDQYKSEAGNHKHIRVHPLLGWREIDIWEYVKREKLPICSLYFAKEHKRYRSIGCAPCCAPVDSDADTVSKIVKEVRTSKIAERRGRCQDKEDEYRMQKLRSLGYM
jgi:sulfate adenylyltransferase subunit 2